MNNEKIVRDSNIELLRIVMMLCVVFLHAISCSGIMDDPTLKEFAVVNSARGVLMTAVNCFVLISGYYGINFKLKGLFKLYAIPFFYGLIGYLIHLIVDGQHIGFSIIYNTIFCISNYKSWFVLSYFLLYLCSPFINVILMNIKKAEYCWLIICLSVFNVYFAHFWGINEIVSNGFSLIQLIYIYIIGFFIGKYYSKEKVIRYKYKLLLISFFTLTLWIVLCIINFEHPMLFWRPNKYNNPVVLVCSVSIFMYFTTLDFSSKSVNNLAKGTYAVYVVHSGPYIWGYFSLLFKSLGDYMTGNDFSVFIYTAVLLLTSMVVMFLILQIDKIRELLMKPFWRIYPKVECRILSLSSKLFRNDE